MLKDHTSRFTCHFLAYYNDNYNHIIKHARGVFTLYSMQPLAAKDSTYLRRKIDCRETVKLTSLFSSVTKGDTGLLFHTRSILTYSRQADKKRL